ncbi:MAG TPA: hypothetical protein VGR07_01305, partial [Thermoanaerobaculia bacterium]|nr:hypothetical protein [Thermoanaerobaculia bacterium]
RPVIGNDGWESVATDIIGIHDYDADPQRLARRYHAEDLLPRLFKSERPGGRLLVLEENGQADLPVMLTEFGGIAYSESARGTWGYSRARTPEELAEMYANLLQVVGSLTLLSGSCYTQFADTYQEVNGLLKADRTPKFPLAEIARATMGGHRRKRRVGPGGVVGLGRRTELPDSTVDQDGLTREEPRITPAAEPSVPAGASTAAISGRRSGDV